MQTQTLRLDVDLGPDGVDSAYARLGRVAAFVVEHASYGPVFARFCTHHDPNTMFDVQVVGVSFARGVPLSLHVGPEVSVRVDPALMPSIHLRTDVVSEQE